MNKLEWDSLKSEFSIRTKLEPNGNKEAYRWHKLNLTYNENEGSLTIEGRIPYSYATLIQVLPKEYKINIADNTTNNPKESATSVKLELEAQKILLEHMKKTEIDKQYEMDKNDLALVKEKIQEKRESLIGYARLSMYIPKYIINTNHGAYYFLLGYETFQANQLAREIAAKTKPVDMSKPENQFMRSLSKTNL